MRRFLTIAALGLALWPISARAQNPMTLSACGPTAFFTAGVSGRITVNTKGELCITSVTGVVLGAGSAIIGKVGIDQTTPGTTNLVALAANQSVNAAQINGVTPLMGNGATGTGALRVSIANDSTGIVALPAAGTSVVGTKAAGTAAATSALSGAVYNSTIPALTDGQQAANQADTTGAVRVNAEGGKATYRSGANAGVDAAGVILQIQGSSTKTVKVTRVLVNGKLTTAASGIIVLQRYSTAASGGTSGAPSAVPLDANDAAATAVVTNYSVVPTAGASVGVTGIQYTFWPSPTVLGPAPTVWDLGTRNAKAITLRGTSQFLAIRTAGFASYTGSDYTIEIEWTEE